MVLLALCAVFGCSGGDDDSPTGTNNACALPWAGTRSWFMHGGCFGGITSDVTDTSTATFSSCTLTMDITPTAEKARGATWTLTANLQSGTAQVVRANTDCAATDTGTVHMNNRTAVAELRSPNNPACSCSLVYTVSVPGPLL